MEIIKQTCLDGPGHYLGSDQTLSLMQTEYVYPNLGDRTSPKEWLEIGKPDLIKNAIKKKNEILSKPSSAEFNPELDASIRKKFKIHLK